MSPEFWAASYRIFGILLLCLLWIRTDSGLAGLFLVLVLVILMLLRRRFPSLRWTLLLDQIAVFSAAVFWKESAFALTLNVFEAVYLGSPLLSIPALLSAAVYTPDAPLSLMLIQGACAGLGLWGWKKQQSEALVRMDNENRKYYELESLNGDLIAANTRVARMAELSERSRIAREIHDHAGHDIVAAYMSFQTVEALLKNDPEKAVDMFGESMKRLENGIERIRETVHNLAPLGGTGADTLRRLCEDFTFCPVKFRIFGDPSKVPVYVWGILEPCLKEALTNILRHTEASSVTVTLDIAPFIARLCVENNGMKCTSLSGGIGLRNLRQRARAAGGNVSAVEADGFRLICVLPIGQEDGS